VIDAKGVYYKELNRQIRAAIAEGATELELINVNGQRYIGDGLQGKITITINGVPGQDLCAFMNGPTIIARSNAQDGVANTMNDGKILIYGNAGDLLGYGMRGGKMFIRGSAGYRVGIHMKSFQAKIPIVVIGGTAGDFLGEYMAGGILILLGLDAQEGTPLVGDYIGTGIHGGVIFIRGEVDTHQVGFGGTVSEIDDFDKDVLRRYLAEYCDDFNLDLEEIMGKKFSKLTPISSRPYASMFTH